MTDPMRLDGRRVLLHAVGPDADITVQALAQRGARVEVLASESDNARLADLIGRRLLSLSPYSGVSEAVAHYDLVLRDPAGSTGESPAAAPSRGRQGCVTLVGGGPGDEQLLTAAGLAAIRAADVIVTDRLAPIGALADLPATTEIVHVGKIPRAESTAQESINDLLVARAAAGKRVVRLKGGDSFVFGRGGEEWNACVAAGVPVRVVPGVTSAIAAPALAGIPVTHRSLSQGFVVVSAHVPPGDPRSSVDWAALAHAGLTIIVLMGVANIGAVAHALMSAGMPADTPAAMVSDAATPAQSQVTAALGGLAEAARAGGVRPPAVGVIGPVVDALGAGRP